jgi:hypothetical protein
MPCARNPGTLNNPLKVCAKVPAGDWEGGRNFVSALYTGGRMKLTNKATIPKAAVVTRMNLFLLRRRIRRSSNDIPSSGFSG